MEILKRGEDPLKKPLCCVCRNCKTKFKVKRSEAKGSGYDPQENRSGFSFACPVCKQIVWNWPK